MVKYILFLKDGEVKELWDKMKAPCDALFDRRIIEFPYITDKSTAFAVCNLFSACGNMALLGWRLTS